MKTKHSEIVSQAKRFQFGANWNSFLSVLSDERIREAEQSLRELLGMDNLTGKRFLDIGSGSGLFSLAARRLGAIVHSFDYDPISVRCTEKLKKRYFPNDSDWIIAQGSVLDRQYMALLGKFDIVYSWGVLHHTGNMKKAFENAKIPVSDNGFLLIAIYNDQGVASMFWKKVKKIYCANRVGKMLISTIFMPLFAVLGIAIGMIKYRNPIGHFSHYKQNRGMSIYYDWIDWFGGYPFEVAKPEEIFSYYKGHGFVLENLKTTNGMGNNQFAFRKHSNV